MAKRTVSMAYNGNNKYSSDMKERIEEICNKLNREQLSVFGATQELLNLFSVSGSLILNEQSLIDEDEQAKKRYGIDNPKEVDAYIEGLKDGAKHYRLDYNDR